MPKKADGSTSYQALSQQLEEVLGKLQDPDVPIDDATRYYEQAMRLFQQLEAHLEQAENQVREIKARFSEEK